jgi:hypothetical protein
MVLWNLLDGGPSHSGPLLGPSEFMQGGTPGTNPHHSSTLPTDGLQFNHIPPSKPKLSLRKPMAATWSSDHSAIYHNLHLRLVIANDLSLAIGFTRIDQKIILMHLEHQSNS